MAKDSKIRLGIVFGGRSGEHEVSLTSAASVISALDPDEFEITAIGITKTGKLASVSEVRAMLPPSLLPRVQISEVLQGDGPGLRVASRTPEKQEDSRRNPQIFFPLLHGPYGEDGTIQGLFEMAGLPFVGCGVLASAVGMDKDVMKRLFLQAGLPSTPHRTVMARDIAQGVDSIRKSAAREFGYPMFSKPANLGSSVGICKIHSEREFEKSIRYSARFDRKILIEKGMDGRELECAILGNDTPQASVVGEVVSAHEFYDYEAKYMSPASRLEIPARIEDKKRRKSAIWPCVRSGPSMVRAWPGLIFSWSAPQTKSGSTKSTPCPDSPPSACTPNFGPQPVWRSTNWCAGWSGLAWSGFMRNSGCRFRASDPGDAEAAICGKGIGQRTFGCLLDHERTIRFVSIYKIFL